MASVAQQAANCAIACFNFFPITMTVVNSLISRHQSAIILAHCLKFQAKSRNVEDKSCNFPHQSRNVEDKRCNVQDKSRNVEAKRRNFQDKNCNVRDKSCKLQALNSNLQALKCKFHLLKVNSWLFFLVIPNKIMFATHQIYSRGQGSALPLPSVAFFFQIGIN
ncbi:hypothetical protein NIES2107_28080 [Nostoc carneum NIES-2107]|nr:hypothetical protein NIES2107_28080 [Nostoc carneum NIES-2107]